MNNRIEWLDTLKALGIFLVVLAHCPIPSDIIIYIYSFHMPLFFFISGIFFNPYKDFKTFIIKKFHTLVIPFFAFSLLSYFSWIVLNGITINKPMQTVMPIFATIYGSNCKNNLIAHNIFIWFLPCLFSTSVLFYLLQKIAKTNFKLIVLTLICFITGLLLIYSLPFSLPWGADTAFIACIFYSAGFLLKDNIKTISFKKHTTIILLTIFFTLSLGLAFLNPKIDMNNYKYGNIMIFLASSFCGIFISTMLAKLIPSNKVINFIGQNSLLIFVIQYPVFVWISFIALHIFSYPLIGNIDRLHQINPTANPILVSGLYLLAPFVISIPLSFVIKKYCPYILGIGISKQKKTSYEVLRGP